MNKAKIILTIEGWKKIEKEYKELVEMKRPLILKRLAEARQEGDLAENSGYIQAKEELSFIDRRIFELREVLNNAVIIKENHRGCTQVDLGCKVTLISKEDNKNHTFWIVGEWEADPTKKKISHISPLGKLLLGKKKGDQVELEAPVGKIVYTITDIE